MSSIDPLQQLIQQMFPHYRSYPVNAMVPALINGPNGPRVAMLAVGDETVVSHLSSDLETDRPMAMAYLEDNRYGIGRDLIIRFELACPSGTVSLETSVPGDEQKGQALVLNALQTPQEIGIFVVDEERTLVRILKADWDPAPYSAVFSLLESRQ